MSEIVAASRVFLNGEPAGGSDLVAEDDEVAVVPPVSGG
jgi:molybdopterin converting factor small subunit